MDLITNELTKYKTLYDSLCKRCATLESEVILMQKLLNSEQNVNKCLNQLFLIYDKNIINNDFRLDFNDLNALTESKLNVNEKSLALNQLRQQLTDWRKINNRFDDTVNTDHMFILPTTAPAVQEINGGIEVEANTVDTFPHPKPVIGGQVSRDTIQTLKIIKKSVKPWNSSQTQTNSRPKVFKTAVNSLLTTVSPTPASTSGASVTTSTGISPVTTAGPSVILSAAESVVTTVDNNKPSIWLEMIPKHEPLSDEETDSAIEAANGPKAQPFLLMSEYLSKKPGFTHLLPKSSDSETQKDEKNICKSIAIDLNSDSDEEMTTSAGAVEATIFDDSIIDLTPKAPADKNIVSKKGFKRKFGHKRFTTKKKSPRLRAKSPEKRTKANTGIKIDRKAVKRKVYSTVEPKSEPESSISITEVTRSRVKRLRTSRMALLYPNQSQTAKQNEYFVKNNRKIVFKDNVYHCKWKGCSYGTDQRANAIRHSWRHTGETPFMCKLCPKGYRDKRLLTAHVMRHNAIDIVIEPKKTTLPLTKGTGNYICPECEGTYHLFQSLIRHIRRIHGLEKAQKYKKCFNKEKSVLLSNKSIDVKNVSVKERNGSQKLTARERVMREWNKTAKLTTNSMKDNALSGIYRAPKVRTSSPVKQLTKRATKVAVESVSEQSLSDEQNQWKCDYSCCERRYNSRGNLRRHQMEVHKRLSKKLFFQSVSRRKSGVNVKYFIPKVTESTDNKPKNDKQFVCDYENCFRAYLSISGLSKHKKVIHKLNNCFLKVDKNSKTANQSADSSALGAAANTATTSPLSTKSAFKKPVDKPSLTRQWICKVPDCKARYTWNKTLIRHMSDKHNITGSVVTKAAESEDEEQYECSYTDCQFRTPIRKTLVTHYKSHFGTGDKPFKCLIEGCNYSQSSLAQLRNHVMNRHSQQAFIRAMETTGVHYPTWY